MSKYKSICLEITNKCNYLCDHCYLSCGPFRNDIMSKSVIDESLKKLGSKAEQVIISGGEPTLFLETIEYVTNCCKIYSSENGYPKEICLRTNGVWAQTKDKAIESLKKFYNIGITNLELTCYDKFHFELNNSVNLLDIKLLTNELNIFNNVKISYNSILNAKKLGRAKMLNTLPYNNQCYIKKDMYNINVHGDIKVCKIGHTCYLGSILDKNIEEILNYDFIDILIHEGINKLIDVFMVKFNKKISFDEFDDICEICHYVTSEWKRNIDERR